MKAWIIDKICDLNSESTPLKLVELPKPIRYQARRAGRGCMDSACVTTPPPAPSANGGGRIIEHSNNPAYRQAGSFEIRSEILENRYCSHVFNYVFGISIDEGYPVEAL